MRCLLAVLLLAGCAPPPPPGTPLSMPVMKCPTLPADRAKAGADPLPPVSGEKLVLAPGHWDWADGNYVWVPASWVPRPNQRAERSGRIWQDGFWTPAGGACVWNPGRFLF